MSLVLVGFQSGLGSSVDRAPVASAGVPGSIPGRGMLAAELHHFISFFFLIYFYTFIFLYLYIYLFSFLFMIILDWVVVTYGPNVVVWMASPMISGVVCPT